LADAGPRYTAVREVLEEVRVPLILDSAGKRVQLDQQDLNQWGSEVHKDAKQFSARCAAHRWAPDLSSLFPVVRFITPELEAQRMKKGGFDTHFFLAMLPSVPETAADGVEVHDLLWLSPAEALEKLNQGELSMAPPQYFILLRLAGLTMQSLAADMTSDRWELERNVPFRPFPIMEEHGLSLALPGDEQHDQYPGVPGAQHRVKVIGAGKGSVLGGEYRYERSDSVALGNVAKSKL